jgi:hypothetical protein
VTSDPTPRFRVGTALVSLVEPPAGRAREYDRWYERDHFYPGMLAGPHCFAGRRWAAPRRLKDLPGALGRGSFLHTYWIEEAAHMAFMDWAREAYARLGAEGRLFDSVEHVDTSFHALDSWAARETDGVPPEVALDHPFPGLVVVRGGEPPPAVGAVVLRVSMTSLPTEGFPDDPAELHLLFLDADPASVWGDVVRDDAGHSWAAAFVPTVPGTDRHVEDM